MQRRTNSTRSSPAFYREADLLNGILPFSSSTLWRMVRRREFPRPVKLAPRVTAWPAAVVHQWIRGREEAER